MSEFFRIDNTKRADFNRCPRYYYYMHERNLRPAYSSTALRAGITWHEMMEAYYNHVHKYGWTRDGKALEQALLAGKLSWERESEGRLFYDDYRSLPNLVDIFMQYISHYSHEEGMLEVIEAEKLFEILMEPANAPQCYFPGLQPFIFQGKIDLVAKVNGRPWVIDHKTTGWQLAKVKQELNYSPQFIGYFMAAKKLFDFQPDGMLIRLTHYTARRVKSGDYGKLTVNFDQAVNVYSQQTINMWEQHLCDVVSRIMLEKRRQVWPMDFDGCNRYGKCPFSELCEQSCRAQEVNTYGYSVVEPWDVRQANESRTLKKAEGMKANPFSHVDAL